MLSACLRGYGCLPRRRSQTKVSPAIASWCEAEGLIGALVGLAVALGRQVADSARNISVAPFGSMAGSLGARHRLTG
jgi:hypothetical protein